MCFNKRKCGSVAYVSGCEDAEKMFKDVGEAYGKWETAVIAG